MDQRLENRMNKIEDKVNMIDKKLGVAAQKLDDHCKQNTIDLDEIKIMLKEALSQKANKWVEWPVKTLIIAVLTSAIGFIIYVIQGHIKF